MTDDDDLLVPRSVWIILQAIVIGVLMLAAIAIGWGVVAWISPAHARDLGQWGNSDAKIRQWYHDLMRPDVPTSPCCGSADAYWADSFTVKGDHYVAEITDDRDDAPLQRPHVPVGPKIEVPNDKLKYDAGNPTGHGILFMSPLWFVYCYVVPGGV